VASDGNSVDVLSPIDGTVVEIKGIAAATPENIELDQYSLGWLLKVRPSRLRPNLLNLLSGEQARQWMRETIVHLHACASPGLGAMAADGGAPVAGMARAIDPADWERVARAFLLTEEKEVTRA
jgi:hypothetical protein